MGGPSQKTGKAKRSNGIARGLVSLRSRFIYQPPRATKQRAELAGARPSSGRIVASVGSAGREASPPEANWPLGLVREPGPGLGPIATLLHQGFRAPGVCRTTGPAVKKKPTYVASPMRSEPKLACHVDLRNAHEPGRRLAGLGGKALEAQVHVGTWAYGLGRQTRMTSGGCVWFGGRARLNGIAACRF